MISFHRALQLSLAGLISCALGRAGEVTIPLNVPNDSRVSLALYATDGRMVRTLLTGKPLAKGVHLLSWDGLDRYGRALPAGEYAWRSLATEGLRAEYITQLGNNPEPAWEKGVCNHEAPTAAAVDATGVYRIGTFDENAHQGAKTDFEGRYLWTTDFEKADPWCHFGAALSVVGARLFLLSFDGSVYRFDTASGRCLASANGEGLWNLRWEGGPAKISGKEGERLRQYVEKVGMDLSSAPEARLLTVSYQQQNAVRWFDAEDGRQVGERSVPEPVAIAAKADGTVLVISQGAVVAVSREGGESEIIIPASLLQNPWRLCVSSSSGDIFVDENSTLARNAIERPKKDFESGVAQELSAGVIAKTSSEGHCQVKRFSAQGHLLAAFGRREGRQDGIYIPTDFQNITDIEADPEGGFVITEGHQHPPRRSAHFDANGKLRREWFGAQQYGVLSYPEPSNPEYVWYHANGNPAGLVRCRVDYKNKTWSIVETYRDCLSRNSLWRSGNTTYRILEREGRLYFTATGFGNLGTVLYEPARKTLRLINRSGRAFRDGRWQIPESLRPSENQRPQSYLWNDLNDDGLAQAEEMQWLNRPELGGPVVPKDFTLFCSPSASGHQSKPKLVPVRFTAGGTPVYIYDSTSTWPAWRENGEDFRGWDLLRGPDGSWFGCFSESFQDPYGNHGAWYFNSCSGIDRLVKWNPEWKPLWSVGRHSPDEDHETGSQAMPRGLVGLTHGCVVWADASDEEIARPTVWTEDGLYVDELLRVPVDQNPKEIYGRDNVLEFALGNLAAEPGTGNVLYYAVSTGGGSPIYRISGWEGWHRQNGTIRWPSQATNEAKRAGTGLKADYFNTPDCTGEPVLTRTDRMVHFHWLKGRDVLPESVNPNRFSCRWTGQAEAPTTETYRFVLETMTPWVGDGWGTPGSPTWLKLWVNGRLVMDTASGQIEATTHGLAGRISLRAGHLYDLKLECGYSGNAVAKLCWDTPSLDRRVIPTAFLYPTISGTAKPEALEPAKRPELLADFGLEEYGTVLSRSRAGVDIWGRLTGSGRRIPGKVGRAIELEAGGEYAPALFPIDEELRLPAHDYTVVFWFKTSAADTRLCQAKRYSKYNNIWSDHIVSLNQGKVRFQLQGDQALQTSGCFDDDQWHQVVTTVGEGGQRLYVDGKLIATGKLAKRTTTSNRLGLELGPGSGKSTVSFDELKVYSRILHEREIADLTQVNSVNMLEIPQPPK